MFGIMPIPDILGLPDEEIAYMVLREEEVLVVETGTTAAGDRYLRTRDGYQVRIVIPALEDHQGDPLSFRTTFDVLVNSEWQPVSGSIDVSLDDPLKVADYPLRITSLSYERREGNPVLTASAVLALPESLDDLEIQFAEVRFSTTGFEQLTLGLGDEEHDPKDPAEHPEFQHIFGEDAFIVNVHYAEAAFGEENHFNLLGAFQSRFFVDEKDDTRNNFPFSASYDNGDWSFAIDLDDLVSDKFNISRASLTVSDAIQVEVSDEELALVLSGVLTLPDLMGENFGVYIDGLRMSTISPYLSVGEISTDLEEQGFSLFNDRVQGTITSFAPSLDTDIPALYLSMAGSLSVFDLPEVTFEELTVGTDGTFSLDGELFIPLLGGTEADNISIISNHLELEQVWFGLKDDPAGDDNGRMHLALDVEIYARIPSPFDMDSRFTLQMMERGTEGVDIAMDGPDFTIPDGFSIDPGRPQVSFGQFATLDLRGLGLDIDLDDITASAFYASAAIYLENNVDKRIEIGNVHDPDKLSDEWGIRVSYDDGPDIQWGNITLVSPPGEEVLSLDRDWCSST